MNCFRYFNFTDFKQVDDLTPYQYRIMMKALSYKQIDEEYMIHRLAFETFRATSTKTMGRNTYPVYKNFKTFYDYEKRLKDLETQYDKNEGKTEDPYADLIAYKRRQQNKTTK